MGLINIIVFSAALAAAPARAAQSGTSPSFQTLETLAVSPENAPRIVEGAQPGRGSVGLIAGKAGLAADSGLTPPRRAAPSPTPAPSAPMLPANNGTLQEGLHGVLGPAANLMAQAGRSGPLVGSFLGGMALLVGVVLLPFALVAGILTALS